MADRAIDPKSRGAVGRALLVAVAIGLVAVVAACSSGSSKSSGKPGTTTTTIKFTGNDSAQFCTKLESFNKSYGALLQANLPAAQLQTLWGGFTTDLMSLRDAGSSEIRPAVATILARVQGLEPVLASVGWDLTKVPPADQKKFQDAAAQKAAQRVSAYGTQVCKVASG